MFINTMHKTSVVQQTQCPLICQQTKKGNDIWIVLAVFCLIWTTMRLMGLATMLLLRNTHFASSIRTSLYFPGILATSVVTSEMIHSFTTLIVTFDAVSIRHWCRLFSWGFVNGVAGQKNSCWCLSCDFSGQFYINHASDPMGYSSPYTLWCVLKCLWQFTFLNHHKEARHKRQITSELSSLFITRNNFSCYVE